MYLKGEKINLIIPEILDILASNLWVVSFPHIPLRMPSCSFKFLVYQLVIFQDGPGGLGVFNYFEVALSDEEGPLPGEINRSAFAGIPIGFYDFHCLVFHGKLHDCTVFFRDFYWELIFHPCFHLGLPP